MARSCSSDSVIGSMSLMNGLAVEAAVTSTMSRGDPLGCLLLHEAEQVAGDQTHLDLLGALGDPIPPVVAVDVLERLVARVSEAAVDLHLPVGSLAAQPVRPVVAHRDLVRHR